MKFNTNADKLLTRLAGGLATLIITASLATPSHAGWEKYFVKSNAVTCAGLMTDMNSQNGTSFNPGSVVTEVHAGTIAEGIMFGSSTATEQWIVLENVVGGGTTFDWKEVWGTYPDPKPAGWTAEGSNLFCLKAGNGRTCFATSASKGSSYIGASDLNTTSKSTEAWFCSDTVEPIASGGPTCPFEGVELYDMFQPILNSSNPQTLLTGFDYHNNMTWTCASPADVVTVCTPESYAPLGQDPTASNPDICDPKTEGCCTIDLATCLAENPGIDPVNCPLMQLGGQSQSASFQKGGRNSCGSSGGILSCSSFGLF